MKKLNKKQRIDFYLLQAKNEFKEPKGSFKHPEVGKYSEDIFYNKYPELKLITDYVSTTEDEKELQMHRVFGYLLACEICKYL